MPLHWRKLMKVNHTFKLMHSKCSTEVLACVWSVTLHYFPQFKDCLLKEKAGKNRIPSASALWPPALVLEQVWLSRAIQSKVYFTVLEGGGSLNSLWLWDEFSSLQLPIQHLHQEQILKSRSQLHMQLLIAQNRQAIKVSWCICFKSWQAMSGNPENTGPPVESSLQYDAVKLILLSLSAD